MNTAISARLVKLIAEGEGLSNERQIELWSTGVYSFLGTALGPGEAEAFLRLQHTFDEYKQHALRIGYLQGLVAKAEADASPVSTDPAANVTAPVVATGSTPSASSRKVFVVHGHDGEAKETTARFLAKLALQPVILHEQPNAGRTIIEKFETYSGDIAFAVVLLTPDDVGATATAAEELKPRARQNVILELGYFIGRLGRTNVCALHRGGVELPSDYQGVLYVEMDAGGAWKAKLAQELVQAKLPIELTGLLDG
ncbi:MAG: nucleotide-binding protein [Gemmatimonadetes bacterium]|nr:nucleotide-binding protein [Gemmatimonadota bacterium]